MYVSSTFHYISQGQNYQQTSLLTIIDNIFTTVICIWQEHLFTSSSPYLNLDNVPAGKQDNLIKRLQSLKKCKTGTFLIFAQFACHLIFFFKCHKLLGGRFRFRVVNENSTWLWGYDKMISNMCLSVFMKLHFITVTQFC